MAMRLVAAAFFRVPCTGKPTTTLRSDLAHRPHSLHDVSLYVAGQVATTTPSYSVLGGASIGNKVTLGKPCL
jgi:hypothetical protein